MTQLPHNHLMSLRIEVDFAGVTDIGNVPAGLRRIGSVTGGHFDGERLRGTVVTGTDWVLVRADGTLQVDVRMTLKTGDGVPIYLTYQGLFRITPENMARFSAGEMLDRSEWSLAVTARFECGDDRYSWLNDVVAVGSGVQTPAGPGYEFFVIS